jgi:hypothetical protein
MAGGTRLHNFREGDRSEYLAVYLLSAFGLVTQVPRQEDIGFDLICNLADKESGNLSFRQHYAVSVKSASTPSIVLDPPESKVKEADYTSHFDWLFHLELPLMLAVVDKEQQSLSLYSTLPSWFVFYEHRHECGVIELVPRMKAGDTNPDVGHPKDLGSVTTAAGRKHFEVDLGHPIVVVSAPDIHDKALLKKKKESLRKAVELGAQTARFAQMNTPFFWWFNVTRPGGYIFGDTNPDGYNGGVAWWIGTSGDPQLLAQMMAGLAPGLMSAALLFKTNNRIDLLQSLSAALRLLPANSVFPQIQSALPEIYSPHAPGQA